MSFFRQLLRPVEARLSMFRAKRVTFALKEKKDTEVAVKTVKTIQFTTPLLRKSADGKQERGYYGAIRSPRPLVESR